VTPSTELGSRNVCIFAAVKTVRWIAKTWGAHFLE
jgi:hypothetical protein